MGSCCETGALTTITVTVRIYSERSSIIQQLSDYRLPKNLSVEGGFIPGRAEVDELLRGAHRRKAKYTRKRITGSIRSDLCRIIAATNTTCCTSGIRQNSPGKRLTDNLELI